MRFRAGCFEAAFGVAAAFFGAAGFGSASSSSFGAAREKLFGTARLVAEAGDAAASAFSSAAAFLLGRAG